MSEFVGFPKIPRYEAETFTITEKIDGTNACLIVDDDGLTCQSRNRIIRPGDDNFGFAKWAHDNADELYIEFGSGRHYGEWWGAGIGRRYGQTTKRFSPFNTHLWPESRRLEIGGIGVEGVPVLVGELPIRHLAAALGDARRSLITEGSYAAPGFTNPEGCMVYLHKLKTYLKAPLDPLPKGAQS